MSTWRLRLAPELHDTLRYAACLTNKRLQALVPLVDAPSGCLNDGCRRCRGFRSREKSRHRVVFREKRSGCSSHATNPLPYNRSYTTLSRAYALMPLYTGKYDNAAALNVHTSIGGLWRAPCPSVVATIIWHHKRSVFMHEITSHVEESLLPYFSITSRSATASLYNDANRPKTISKLWKHERQVDRVVIAWRITVPEPSVSHQHAVEPDCILLVVLQAGDIRGDSERC
nr:hypothetical protein CFP56_33424 [Quercus suber]